MASKALFHHFLFLMFIWLLRVNGEDVDVNTAERRQLRQYNETKYTLLEILSLKAVMENQAGMIQQQAEAIQEIKSHLASLETNVQTRLQSGYSARKVAFTARFRNDNAVNGLPLSYHQVLKFDDVVTNIGSGYSTQSGMFTAPFTGVYAFFLSFMTTEKRRSVLLAIVNQGTVLALVYGEGISDPQDQGSSLVTTYMTAGQQVWVRQHEGDAIRGAWYTIFSGFLVDLD